MNVYVVSHGERYEGSKVMSVWSNRDDAVNAALSTECHFDGGWTKSYDDCWFNGIDYVCVEQFGVQNAPKTIYSIIEQYPFRIKARFDSLQEANEYVKNHELTLPLIVSGPNV